MDLSWKSDYFAIQHWLIGFYNWDDLCLLRGTDWVFKLKIWRFVLKGLSSMEEFEFVGFSVVTVEGYILL